MLIQADNFKFLESTERKHYICLLYTSQPDTRIMLCSDGISDMLTEVEIQAILNRKKNASDTVHDLMKLALEKGGRDNATVILCQVHERKAKEPIRERLKKVLQL